MREETGLPPGYRAIVYPQLGSTNDEAARLARQGAETGVMVRAVEQSAGRGRRGRTWVSPPGNLYVSTILRPGCPLGRAAQLSFVAALAIAETAAEVLGPGPVIRCKWPNDVLVGGAKLAGILLEAEADALGRAAWVVIGTGVNILHHPPQAEYPAISLRALGATADADSVLPVFAHALDRRYRRWQAEGFAPIRREWLDHAAGLGEAIRVRLAERTVDGVFAGLDLDGVLLLHRPDGASMRVTAGDVFFPVRMEG